MGRGLAKVKRFDAVDQELPLGINRTNVYLRGGEIIKGGRIRASIGYKNTKSFSITKYGEEKAIQLAIEWREAKKLNYKRG